MPVLSMNMSKRPDNPGDVKATGYPGILINIAWIIIVNEIVPERLAKNDPRKHSKKDANADEYPAAACLRESD
jgi:hypothetical protein